MKHSFCFTVIKKSAVLNLPYMLNLNMQIMETRKNLGKEREDLKNYLSQINYDGMFFKGQMILGGILIFVFLIYFMWMA